MAENPILLSLCVPTYNRADLLIETLGVIAGQARSAGLVDQVEIVVSDNASTDDTQDKLNEFVASHGDLSIKTHKQQTNLGPDGNIYTVVKMATGAFIWILSDDDLLFSGALQTVFRIARQFPDVGAFCPNIRGFTHTLEDAGPIQFHSDSGFIQGKDEALDHIGYMITFLSVLIIRRDLVLGRNYDERIGTDIIHSYMFLDVLRLANGLYVISDPLLGCRMFNSGGYNFFRILVSNFNDLLSTATKAGFGKSVVQDIQHRYLRKYLLDMVYMFKIQGTVGRLRPNFVDAFKRMAPIYYNDPFFYTRIVPYMLCPAFMMRYLVKVKAAVEGRLSNS